MAWKTRTLLNGRLSEIITIDGDRPSCRMDIQDLITSLQRIKDKGAAAVCLDGLATLHAEGAVLLATESQI